MKIKIRESAIKDLKRIPNPHKTKIHNKIKLLTCYSNLSNVKKLTNFVPSYRYRVGNYRVLFDVTGDVVAVARVLHRSTSYKQCY
ncbi:MAG: type II toxin-antitoxin system RelE/ParE family toxin [Gammaproteobacteria bacterium]|nr:MAG: type II toxin-antitoxin system RelE/ParE family toxin [Gammaproteobacteria bacterium]